MTQIKFENRFDNMCPNQKIFVSLDGVDFPINETYPFDKKLYSHKLNGPGIRYDVGICIRTGNIVYWSGGDKAGKYDDLSLARRGICRLLNPGEKVLADKGYRDARYFVYPTNIRGDNSLLKKISARHENINARLTCWGVLRNRYRGDLYHHLCLFSAIIEVEQFKLKHGNELQKIRLHNYNI